LSPNVKHDLSAFGANVLEAQLQFGARPNELPIKHDVENGHETSRNTRLLP